MNVAIVGSRGFQDYESLRSFILNSIDITSITCIISGGAKGADALGEDFAKEFNIPKKIYYADWDKYGKKAGYLRNITIIENSDIVFCFWDGTSKGTLSDIELAKKNNKKLYIYNY